MSHIFIPFFSSNVENLGGRGGGEGEGEGGDEASYHVHAEFENFYTYV